MSFFTLSTTIVDKQMTSRMTSTFSCPLHAKYLQDGPEKWATNSPKPALKTGGLTSKMTSTADSHFQGEMTE